MSYGFDFYSYCGPQILRQKIFPFDYGSPLRLYNLRRADKTDENASGLGADSILNGNAQSNNYNCRRLWGRGGI